MIKYRFIIGAGISLAVIICCLLEWRIKLSDTPTTPQLQDWIKLERAVQALRDYAKAHNGEYPVLNTPTLTNRLGVKGFLVVSNLPATYSSGDSADSKAYPFLYFPIDSSVNKELPLNDPNKREGLRAKILAASVNVFVQPKGGGSYRIVEYYDNDASGPMAESDFEKFLSLGADVPYLTN